MSLPCNALSCSFHIIYPPTFHWSVHHATLKATIPQTGVCSRLPTSQGFTKECRTGPRWTDQTPRTDTRMLLAHNVHLQAHVRVCGSLHTRRKMKDKDGCDPTDAENLIEAENAFGGGRVGRGGKENLCTATSKATWEPRGTNPRLPSLPSPTSLHPQMCLAQLECGACFTLTLATCRRGPRNPKYSNIC